MSLRPSRRAAILGANSFLKVIEPILPIGITGGRIAVIEDSQRQSVKVEIKPGVWHSYDIQARVRTTSQTGVEEGTGGLY